MTFFHLANCLALGYVPYFITYKYSKLSEYSAFNKCIKVGAMYFITQAVKLLALATIFPVTYDASDTLDARSEIIKCTIDLLDVTGLYFALSYTTVAADCRILAVGMGWSAAEFMATRILPLWVGARGVEFEWKYILLSFDGNISLIQYTAVAALMWNWLRLNDSSKVISALILLLISLLFFMPVIFRLLIQIQPLRNLGILPFKVVFTSTIGVYAMYLYFAISAKPRY
ncbi:Transmembrane protein 147 [Trichoplax sp. H2]|uniref:BOS complex subunit TMEM147 n=1 Tax=Trichoplax adhaerens TaxID=10228 RepID=B3SCC8_TRIAD|nr:hypothetical protein TRIADDRAFT_61929 [Trichoplax adhaerens]EDV19564.1 hypothetical protein TRIADDRAFT_61929 [Trichoplax adhaerens]RDD41610.1 Transmembrane protein 147 [Trichoplax sp. H2]|eukprot:XP_002117897.1 hypothetical protein TRIADDRAFT_61929 [Trichoplax adhaerens]